MWWMLPLACSPGSAPIDTGPRVVDTGPWALDTAAEGASLHGERTEPRPPPDFSAIAHTGEPRSAPDLVGHPTVVWFYPAANTYG